jgi:hypothetical protein
MREWLAKHPHAARTAAAVLTVYFFAIALSVAHVVFAPGTHVKVLGILLTLEALTFVGYGVEVAPKNWTN